MTKYFLAFFAASSFFWALSFPATAQIAQTAEPDAIGVSVPLAELSSVMSPEDVIAVAKRLIMARQTDPARRLLEDVADRAPDPVEITFLLASIAVTEQRYDDAVDLYRDILTNQPSLTRVRLELARTLFLNKEDEAAEHHFRLVLATEPKGLVATNIRKFLDAIWDRRVFRYTVSMAVAPDSNINVAPEDERVDLFGLPFTLDDDAQKTSGVGFVASGGIEYLPRLNARTKLQTNLYLRHSQYSGSTFDDTFISLNAGPTFYWSRTRLTVQATGYYRWFGHEEYNRSAGVRASFYHDLSRKWRMSTILSFEHVNYFLNNSIDGPVYNLLASATYGITSRSYLRTFVGFRYEKAQALTLRNWETRLGVSLYQELPWGIITYIQPEVTYNPYKGVQQAFAVERTDWQYRVGVSLIKRDLEWHGFAPELRYTYIKNDSTIDFYSYTRHRVEIGVTRQF